MKSRRDGDRRDGDGPGGGKRERDNRGKDRRKDHGGKGAERREYSSRPPRERGPDPDSPFAALAVLKERVRGN